MDKLTQEQRRRSMQAVKSKNSQLEVSLGKALWSRGYRYSKNDKRISSLPDITFKNIGLPFSATVNFDMGKIGKSES